MTLEKIYKKLDETVRNDIDNMSESDLQKLVVQAEEAISVATTERDENPKYQTAKESVSALSQGLKDVKAYQGAKIQYALIRLRDMGRI